MICDIDDAKEIVPDLPFYYDEPFGDSSAIPTILVSKEARKHVTVALSADAGDELFAGYPRHKKSLKYIQKLNEIPLPIRSVMSTFLKVMPHTEISKADRFDKMQSILKAKDDVSAFDIINCTYSKKEIDCLVTKQHQHLLTDFDNGQLLNHDLSILKKILAIEYKTYLVDDILQKVDRASMSVSLEGREPFLDHRILELVATFDDSYKLHDGIGKRILKDIVHKYVPKDLMERPKMGFGVPIQSWLKNELIDLFEEVLSDKIINQQDILNANLVRKLKQDYLSNKLEDFERLWFVFVFLQWYKQWHQH
jgi:asparagine synthase (glutamine-hydrolysing)